VQTRARSATLSANPLAPPPQVNLKLFAPDPNRNKTVLLFVIRDKSKTPIDKIREILLEDLAGIWANMSKPPQYVDSSAGDFFEVQVRRRWAGRRGAARRGGGGRGAARGRAGTGAGGAAGPAARAWRCKRAAVLGAAAPPPPSSLPPWQRAIPSMVAAGAGTGVGSWRWGPQHGAVAAGPCWPP
jgi:hypothetical protein